MNYQRILVLTGLGVDPQVTFIAAGETESELRAIRRCTRSGRLLGTGEFVEKLERHTQRRLAPQKEVAQISCFPRSAAFLAGTWEWPQTCKRRRSALPAPQKRGSVPSVPGFPDFPGLLKLGRNDCIH
jgi:hypothetical protein